MTSEFSFETVALVVASVLATLGTVFSWPLLVRVADWIKARDTKPETKNGTPTPIADEPLALVSGQAAGLPGWLILLLPLFAEILPILLELLSRFRQQNGRQPTAKEVGEMVRQAQAIKATQMATPEMPDRDLEKVAAGKETIGRANRTLDAIDAAVRDIGTAARSGDSLFRRGEQFLGS